MTGVEERGKWVVARVVAGVDVSEEEIEGLGEPWRMLARAVIGRENGSRCEALRRELAKLPNGDTVEREILAMSPREPPSAVQAGAGDALLIPELPRGAGLDPEVGKGAGAWLDTYSRYAGTISPMSPNSFHVTAALFLVAVAIARRLVLRVAWDDIFSNIFVLWCALTTLYRKSTSLNIARRIGGIAFPHLFCAQETTPEAFLSDLAGREPSQYDAVEDRDRTEWQARRNYAAQVGWLLDEMSGLLSSAGKDYNRGLVETMLRCYDCTPRYVRSTRLQGHIVVRNTYLSMLTASTPAALAPHLLSESLWGSGFWPRFAILTPDTERPQWREAQACEMPPEIVLVLRGLYERLPSAQWPDPPEAVEVYLGTGVWDAFRRYNKAVSYQLLLDPDLDRRLFGLYGRLPTQLLKVTMLLAALDWPQKRDNPRIELPHLARAMAITEEWRSSGHRALAMVGVSDFERLRVRILRVVSKYEPKGASARDVGRSMRDKKPAEVREAVGYMVEQGDLYIERGMSGPKGGRPTLRYHLVKE